MASLLLLLLGLPFAEPPEVRTVLELDGHPSESFTVKGAWSFERRRGLVRSGSGSLRITMGPPGDDPGIYVAGDQLAAPGWRWLVVDVYSTAPAPLTLRIRLDDAESTGEAERFRKSVTLEPRWNRVALDLRDLPTTSGSRRLDPATLRRLILHRHKPEEGFDLLFDHLRLERPRRPDTHDERSIRVRRLDRQYRPGVPGHLRRRLLEGVAFADVPERCRVLHRRVFLGEDDARLIEEAVRVLGHTRRSASVAEAVRLARRADGEVRWRWLDALGRMRPRSARRFVREVAETARSPADRTAALRALVRAQDPSFVPLCRSDLAGSWQLRTARVGALRRIQVGEAFPALVAYLDDPAARVRHDAQAALAALSGRDLGRKAEAWLAWWEVNRDALGGSGIPARPLRSPYGTYYGLPLYAGRLCFVIDVSGSMKAPLGPRARAYAEGARHLEGADVTTRLDLAREEARHAIESLPEETHIQLLWYETTVFTWSRYGPVPATRANKRDLLRKLDTLHAGGSTNLHGALVRAFEPRDGLPFRQLYEDSVDTVYLLSDGVPSAGDVVDPRHLLADLRERNRVRMIRINTIGMGRRDNALLRGLARDSGGDYVDLAR